MLVASRLDGKIGIVCWCIECKSWWLDTPPGSIGEEPNKLYLFPCDPCYEDERDSLKDMSQIADHWVNRNPYKETQDEPTEASTVTR